MVIPAILGTPEKGDESSLSSYSFSSQDFVCAWLVRRVIRRLHYTAVWPYICGVLQYTVAVQCCSAVSQLQCRSAVSHYSVAVQYRDTVSQCSIALQCRSALAVAMQYSSVVSQYSVAVQCRNTVSQCSVAITVSQCKYKMHARKVKENYNEVNLLKENQNLLRGMAGMRKRMQAYLQTNGEHTEGNGN